MQPAEGVVRAVILIRNRLVLGRALMIFLLAAGLLTVFWANRPGLMPVPAGVGISSEGRLDLSGWSFERQGRTELNGEWAFYEHMLLAPEDLKAGQPVTYIKVPAAWNRYEAEAGTTGFHSGTGYGTYRLQVLLPQANHLYALRIPTISTAYRLWINGEEAARAGEPGATAEASVPKNEMKTVPFSLDTRQLDLVLQVSNFHHSMGGVRHPIELGDFGQMQLRDEFSLGFDLLLFGSLTIMGLYHLGLFTIRRQDSSALYFGLYCLLTAFRTLFIGDIAVVKLFPGFPWELEMKLEYLSAYGVLCLYMLFIGKLYHQACHHVILRWFSILCGAYTLLTLCTPALIYTRYLLGFHLIAVAGMLYMLYVLYTACRQKQEGSLILLSASFLYALLLFNDILYTNGWAQTTGRASGIGLLVFIVCQSLVLSTKLSRAFANVENLSAALAELNGGLQAKIKAGTADLKWAHDTLLKKNKELSRLERSRSRLLSNISHDLGTPLTTIQCYLEAILDGMIENDDKRRQYIRLIHDKVLGMGRLIDDLFHLSQLEARQVEFKSRRMAADKLIHQLHARYELDASNAGLTYELRLSANGPKGTPYPEVCVDLERMHQAFSNLIYNAIKFTPPGGSIIVEMTDSGAETMLCRVSDTGAGIHADDLPNIFDRFYTSSSPRNVSAGGKGLGLSISKEIIESHGGRIWVERSELQAGTVFCFTLPWQQDKRLDPK